MLNLFLASVKPGEQAEFAAFYHEYSRLVLYMADQFFPGDPRAEDVAQEVFLYAAKNFERLPVRDGHKMARYLVLCTKSRAMNLLLAEREHPSAALDAAALADQTAAPDDTTEDRLVSLDSAQRLLQAVAQLKEIYRIPLELKIRGMTDLQAAELMGIPAATFRKRLQRARALLLEKMEEYDGESYRRKL